MSRILFVMLHPGFIRYYEDALCAIADAGHQVHVAFEISRDKLREDVLADRLAARSDRITCGTTPPRAESVRDFLVRGDRSAARSGERPVPAFSPESRERAWESLATTVRLLLDYLRFFEPAFTNAGKLRDRAEKRVPHVYRAPVRALAAGAAPVRRLLARSLRAVEQLIPVNRSLEAFVREHNPDLLLVTPLIELGSQQVDYVKCARRLGVRSALCVASWDNLTSKGLIRVAPDHVVVWNEAQKAEAVSLHGVAPERVVVTGAQPFDRWFAARPSRSREEFCRRVGLDPGCAYVLYVGSSMFIAPDEVPFAERWLSRLRASDDPAVATVGVLIRPHPANARQWRTLDPARWTNVALWPPIGSDPNAAEVPRDYFDSLYYSAAVVGINTSAQLEAGIVERPVFTVQTSEFAHSQEGTLHFQHLARFVHRAATLDEHVAQLAGELRGGLEATAANCRFARAFTRPFGDSVAAVPVFVKAIDELARMPRVAARREPVWTRVARPPAFIVACVARALADDRPLWAYALRPAVAAGVTAAAGVYRVRGVWRSFTRGSLKPLRRSLQRAWHESSRSLDRRWRRANRPLARAARHASGAVKRAVRREL